MNDIMVDIETMGPSPTAAIIQIAAVTFNRSTAEIGNIFKVNVDLQSSIDAGLIVDASTINWWMFQSEKARKSIFNKDVEKYRIEDALSKFSFWAKESTDNDNFKVWCHVSYDFAILTNAFNKTRVEIPWEHKAGRDIWTLNELSEHQWYGEREDNQKGVLHDALDDVMYQVEYVVENINRIRVEK